MIKQIADQELPQSMAYEWTELTYLQLEAGNTAIAAFGLAVVFVFLVLAALYESWTLPLAVILVVPMCLLCSIAGVELAGSEVTIFTQIGFVVLVGLASKNAILIVEFTKQLQEAGMSSPSGHAGGVQLRLRPIVMTSFAFILGVIPLAIATGAGAEMRAVARDRRLLRDARRDPVRDLPHARLLRRDLPRGREARHLARRALARPRLARREERPSALNRGPGMTNPRDFAPTRGLNPSSRRHFGEEMQGRQAPGS